MTHSWIPLSLPNLYIRHEKVAEIYKFLNVGHNPLYIIPHGTSKDIIPPDTFPQARTLSHLGPALDNKTLIIHLCVTNPIYRCTLLMRGRGREKDLSNISDAIQDIDKILTATPPFL